MHVCILCNAMTGEKLGYWTMRVQYFSFSPPSSTQPPEESTKTLQYLNYFFFHLKTQKHFILFHITNLFCFVLYTVLEFLKIVLGLKGTVQRDCLTTFFFHHSNLPGPLINGLTYFWFWLRFPGDFQKFWNLLHWNLPQYHTAQSQSPCSIILPGVNLPAVSYYGKSLMMTLGSQQPFLQTFAQACKWTVSQK